jgi:hypothetical protein
MRYSGNYVIHKTKQLIDINQSIQNFKALIEIECQNEDDILDIVIVTQEELDSEDFELNYKQIEHKVKIEMEPENKDDVQHYIMVLRSDNNVNVSIKIDVTDLDESESESEVKNNTKTNANTNTKTNANPNTKTNTVSKNNGLSIGGMLPKDLFCKKNLIYVIILLFVGYLLYHFVFNKQSTDENVEESENKNACITENNDSTEITLNDLEIDSSTSQVETKPSHSSSVLSTLRKLRNKN